MTLRTKGEQKAYLDGYEMCADCIEMYLTDKGKRKLECLLVAVRNAVEIEDVEYLPPVTPKTGHWIFQKIKQGKRMWCSNCNSSFDLCCSQIKRYNEATGDDDIWIYCPWCGAKMVEPQESEEEG